MRMQEQDHIARILENMKKDKPWAKMDGKIAWKRSLKVRVVVVDVVVVVVMLCIFRRTIIESLLARLRLMQTVSEDI